MPLLFSLLLHGLVFWPSLQTMTPTAFATRPALSGHLHATPSPELPQVPVSDAAVTGHRSVTKKSAASKPSAAPASQREEVAESAPVIMQISNIAVDAGGLRSYRVALARSLAGSAWRNGLSPQVRGTLEVGIKIDAAGTVQEIGLVRSSGQAELDRRILDAVRMAVGVVAIPSALQSQAFFLVLPIEVGEPISAADR